MVRFDLGLSVGSVLGPPKITSMIWGGVVASRRGGGDH